MVSAAAFDRLFGNAQRTAVHLEMRDIYIADDPAFLAWQKDGTMILDDPDSEHWTALVRKSVAHGVVVRRARIVSEPVSEYIRYEHATTAPFNVAAGELVRWLPRRQATDLALPGNDFWLFDGVDLLINHFSGNGDWIDTEMVSNPDVIKLCSEAFEAVWARATDNAAYQAA